MLKKSFYFFMSVVETGSFSQAAKKHYLSQAAISQQISKLEEEVGVRLFDRSKYRPELTEAGKYYYQKIKQLSEEYEKIEKQTRYIQKKNSQKIVGMFVKKGARVFRAFPLISVNTSLL